MLKAWVSPAVLAVPLLFGIAGAAAAQQPKVPPKPAPLPAQPAPTPVAPLPPAQNISVMVVDVQALLQDSKAAKMVRAQIEAKRAEYTKEISHEEEMLRAERDALQRQEASMTSAELNRRGREFQEKVNELDASVQAKRQALEKSNNDALAKIQQEMLKIIADIAKERKSNLVLQRTDLVLFDRSFDVTDEVMQKLDEQMPVMTVNFVKPQPPPAALVGPVPAAQPPAKPRRR